MKQSNKDIFSFPFVDREKDKIIFQQFMKTPNDSILWVTGERGTGKSFFIEQCLQLYGDENLVTITVDAEKNTSSSEYIGLFLERLEEAANMKFWEFLKANYSSIIELAHKTLEIAVETSDVKDYGLVGTGFSIAREYVDKKKKRQNTATVIRRYIQHIAAQRPSTTIVLDNFTRCDEDSLNILKTVLNSSHPIEGVKYIVCTTTEDLELRDDIKKLLICHVEHTIITVKPFNSQQYFKDILAKGFDVDMLPEEELYNLFNACKGKPQKLIEFLQNLYLKEGIEYSEISNKRYFVLEQYRMLVAKEQVGVAYNNMGYAHKKLVEVLAVWGRTMPYSLLENFITELVVVDYSVISIQDKLPGIVAELEDTKLVKKEYVGSTICIKLAHDNLYINVKRLMGEQAFSFLSNHIFRYLKLMKSQNSHKSVYFQANFDYLYALHAYHAKEDGWEKINYQFAHRLHFQQQYFDAYRIFRRLGAAVFRLCPEGKILYAHNLMLNGAYNDALEMYLQIFNNQEIQKLSMEDQVAVYLNVAKLHSILLSPAKALASLQTALSLVEPHTPEHITIKNTQQIILFLSPGGYQEAEAIYHQLIDDYSDQDCPEMAAVYLTAMDYYSGDDSLALLKRSVQLYQEPHPDFSEIHIAKAIHNIGFELIRCGRYQEAEEKLAHSIAIFKNLSYHRQSYSLTNRSVIYMIQGNWTTALVGLKEALFWAKAQYPTLVAKTNIMICLYFQKEQEWKDYYTELLCYLDQAPAVDNNIYKKILLNAAIIMYQEKDFTACSRLLEKCEGHIHNERANGKYRYQELYNKIKPGTYQLVELEETHRDYYASIVFEPWLITFSHD